MLTETVMCYLFSRFKEIFKGNFCLSLFNFQGPKPPISCGFEVLRSPEREIYIIIENKACQRDFQIFT